LNKILPFDKINEQLKNIGEEDMTEATNHITNLLGADDNEDVKDVCDDLIKNIVGEIQNNGGDISNMFDIAKKVTDKIGNSIDKDKMQKTASKLSDFLNNGESMLKNMKDENGNAVGEDIMNQMKGPLEMMKNMENNNGQMDMSALAGMMGQMGMKGMNKN